MEEQPSKFTKTKSLKKGDMIICCGKLRPSTRHSKVTNLDKMKFNTV